MRNRVKRALVIFFLSSLAVGQSQTFSVIRTLSGYLAPNPFGRMLVSESVLYGTTMGGGTYGYGSVFRMATNGSGYTTLKSFPQTYSANSGLTNADGATPLAGLTLSGDTLYGTAYGGGFWSKGTLFSLKTNGSGFTVLRQFSGDDGKAPYADLLTWSNVIYGTTAAGGVSNKGTIFRLNTDGSGFEVLKSFIGSDGLLPLGGLALAGDTLYGSTLQGGSWNHGTVFSIHTNGSGFTVLKEFTGADGSHPRFAVIVSGNSIFGTTEGDGDLSNSLVYKLNTDGSDFQMLKTFSQVDPISGTNGDGYYVRTGLALSGSTLFGTTRWGGNFGSGVIFALRADGSAYTVLKHFSATTNDGRNSDGATPLPSLALGGQSIYGAAENGGLAGVGTIFRLNFAPRIEMNDGGFGKRTNGFGFNISGYSNQIVVVESCTNLTAPLWLPQQTNVIDFGTVGFLDGNSTNCPQSYYRLHMQ